MKKILALGFLGFAHACTDRTTRTDCYEDSNGYQIATGKTITNLVLTEIVDLADAQSRGYTAADVGKYGISNCDGSTDTKTWGDDKDGNVVECDSVYNNLASDLVRNAINPGTATEYHRILLQTNAKCDTITDPINWCSIANGYNRELIGNKATTECAGETCSEAVDAATCCQITCGSGKYNTAAAGEQRVCADCLANTYSNSDNAVSCTPHTKCVAGKYRSSTGNSNVNSECDDCNSGEYSNSGIAGWDNVLGNKENYCPAWSTCSALEYQSNTPSTTVNRECSPNTCTCTGGTPATGAACTTHNAEICTACDTDRFLYGVECKLGVTGFKLFAARKTVIRAKREAKQLSLLSLGELRTKTPAQTEADADVSVVERFQRFQAAMDARASATAAPDLSQVTCDDVNGHTSKKCIRDAMLTEILSMRIIINGNHVNMLNRGDKRTKVVAQNHRVKMSKDKDKIEFDMHADGDFQIIEISNTIDCVLTSSVNNDADMPCTFETVGGGRRLTGASGCFTGSATLNNDGSYSFDPAAVLIDKTCSVTAVEDGEDVSYNVVPCDAGPPQTYTGDNRTEASAVYTADTTCGACAPGDGLGVGGTCEDCSSGSHFNSEFDSSACDACPTGSSSSTDDLSCTCIAGWTGDGYTDSPSTDPNPGCTECAAGTYDDGSVCQPCASGSVQSTAGQTACDQCGLGTYDDGSEVCQPCAGGSVQPTAGQTSCVPCVGGEYDDGSEVCQSCDPGKAASSATGTCEDCQPGFFQFGNDDNYECEACADGSVQPTAGQTSCAQCGLGTYDDGSEVCQPCADGSVQPDAGKTSCTVCVNGEYDDGSEECKSCDPGKAASSNTGTCANCQPGFFQAGNDDNYACEACDSGASGTYSSEVGQISCKSCSLFSTEWINTQCCSDSSLCPHLTGQCGTSC